MRWSLSLSAVFVLGLAASQASAQCYYIAPPQAPDMRNPGYYYQNCYGVIYGPNYFVRPPFPPYQGVIPGPPPGKHGHGGHGGGHGLAQYANDPAAFQKAMDKYYVTQSFGGFPRMPYVRSPRDFFMYDTDPSRSPYNYGYSGNGARYDGCND